MRATQPEQVNIAVSALRHDVGGELTRVNWSHFARDNQLDLPIDQVEQLYTAMRAYDDLLEENHIKLKDHFRYLASGLPVTITRRCSLLSVLWIL